MEYHKIQTIFFRDPATNHKTLLEGQFSKPEFEYLKDNEWVFTEKVDGTNIRIIWDGEKLRFGGRTEQASIPTFLLNNLLAMFEEKKMAEVFGPAPAVLYGESYGAKIQKGGGNYLSTGTSFALFDLHVGGNWQERASVEKCAETFGISIVPIIGRGNIDSLVAKVREGFSSAWGQFQAEGIVARPAVEMVDRCGHRIITKLKCKDFPK